MSDIKRQWIKLRMTYSHKMNHSLHSFHKTTFAFSDEWKMAVMFILLYIIGDYVSSGIDKMMGIHTINGTSMVVSFICVELIPILFIGFFVAMARDYTHTSHHFFTDLWITAKRWFLKFVKDLWNHRALIITMIIVVLVMQMVSSSLISQIFFHGHVTPTRNQRLLLKFIRQNKFMILASSLVAPVVEELFFRYWATGLMFHLISKTWNGHASKFLYFMCAFTSAMFFAGLHLQGQSPIRGIVYLIFGLLMQWLQKRTQSLTAPVLVHSCSNLLVTGLTMSA